MVTPPKRGSVGNPKCITSIYEKIRIVKSVNLSNSGRTAVEQRNDRSLLIEFHAFI